MWAQVLASLQAQVNTGKSRCRPYLLSLAPSARVLAGAGKYRQEQMQALPPVLGLPDQKPFHSNSTER